MRFRVLFLLNVLVCANVDARPDSALSFSRIKQTPLVQKLVVMKDRVAQKLLAGGLAVFLVCTSISCSETEDYSPVK